MRKRQGLRLLPLDDIAAEQENKMGGGGYNSVSQRENYASSCRGLGPFDPSNSDIVVWPGVLDGATCELPPSSLGSGLTETYGGFEAVLFCAWRRRKNQKARPAMTTSAPTPTPTPMPILAPVDKPPDPESDESPEPEPSVAVGDELVVPVAVADVEPDVVVAVTNRLESDSCSCTWMGCAHMVIGPETCVLSVETWRTVTMVELELGNMLVHPAKVVPLVGIVRYLKSLRGC